MLQPTALIRKDEYQRISQRVSKAEPFIGKYNWEGMNYSLVAGDWKRFEEDNSTIALHV